MLWWSKKGIYQSCSSYFETGVTTKIRSHLKTMQCLTISETGTQTSSKGALSRRGKNEFSGTSSRSWYSVDLNCSLNEPSERWYLTAANCCPLQIKKVQITQRTDVTADHGDWCHLSHWKRRRNHFLQSTAKCINILCKKYWTKTDSHRNRTFFISNIEMVSISRQSI